MYGSQFHFESLVTGNYKRAESLSVEEIPTINCFKVLLVIVGLALSTIVFAGPSEPRFPHGMPAVHER